MALPDTPSVIRFRAIRAEIVALVKALFLLRERFFDGLRFEREFGDRRGTQCKSRRA
jgi:hypothetical protein